MQGRRRSRIPNWRPDISSAAGRNSSAGVEVGGDAESAGSKRSAAASGLTSAWRRCRRRRRRRWLPGFPGITDRHKVQVSAAAWWRRGAGVNAGVNARVGAVAGVEEHLGSHIRYCSDRAVSPNCRSTASTRNMHAVSQVRTVNIRPTRAAGSAHSILRHCPDRDRQQERHADALRRTEDLDEGGQHDRAAPTGDQEQRCSALVSLGVTASAARTPAIADVDVSPEPRDPSNAGGSPRADNIGGAKSRQRPTGRDNGIGQPLAAATSLSTFTIPMFRQGRDLLSDGSRAGSNVVIHLPNEMRLQPAQWAWATEGDLYVERC